MIYKISYIFKISTLVQRGVSEVINFGPIQPNLTASEILKIFNNWTKLVWPVFTLYTKKLIFKLLFGKNGVGGYKCKLSNEIRL